MKFALIGLIAVLLVVTFIAYDKLLWRRPSGITITETETPASPTPKPGKNAEDKPLPDFHGLTLIAELKGEILKASTIASEAFLINGEIPVEKRKPRKL